MPSYNRSRTRGDLNIQSQIRTETSPAGCSLAANSVNFYNVGFKWGARQTMADNLYGGWKKRKGKQFIFNDMLNVKTDVVLSGTSSYLFTSVGNRCAAPVMKNTDAASGPMLAYWCSPCSHQATNLTDSFIKSLEDEVWTDCLQNRGKSDANLLESFAEAEKAWRMLQTPFENISSLVKSFRRSAKRQRGYQRVASDSKAFMQFASSEWLRFRYGISPILSDIAAVMKALRTGHPPGPIVVTARSQQQFTDVKVFNSSINSSTFRCDYAVSTADTVKVKAYWYDRYQPSFWNDLGFNAQNLLVLPWELTRYSFVVDWVTNIGAVAYANAPRVSFESLGGQVVITRSLNTYYVPTAFVNLLPLSWTLTGSVSDTVRRTDVTVDRHTRPPTTNFVVRSNFKLDNWVRATDAVSVAIQWLSSIGFARH
jgi:hypothetical protein